MTGTGTAVWPAAAPDQPVIRLSLPTSSLLTTDLGFQGRGKPAQDGGIE